MIIQVSITCDFHNAIIALNWSHNVKVKDMVVLVFRLCLYQWGSGDSGRCKGRYIFLPNGYGFDYRVCVT